MIAVLYMRNPRHRRLRNSPEVPRELAAELRQATHILWAKPVWDGPAHLLRVGMAPAVPPVPTRSSLA